MRLKKFFIVSLGLIAAGFGLAALIPFENPPVITSLTVGDGNLNFTASLPPGLEKIILEMRPALTAPWQPATVIDAPADGGTIAFSIPQPDLASAFFRLNATALAATNTTSSAELQYVTMPPLGPESTNDAPDEAVFHFQGMVDGSDRIVITRTGAFWEHVNWAWPGAVSVNQAKWNPSVKNFLTTTGAVSFLPKNFSLANVNLEKISGRDTLALERTNDALIVYLDDTPTGPAPYEFKIHFHPPPPQAVRARATTVATLKIAAQIDGSDRLKLTAHAAVWTHQAWSPPARVKLNDVSWDVRQTNVLTNVGTNAYLPTDVDFSTAKIIRRQGRDLVTLWAERDAIWVSFADNPNGADDSEVEISFGE